MQTISREDKAVRVVKEDRAVKAIKEAKEQGLALTLEEVISNSKTRGRGRALIHSQVKGILFNDGKLSNHSFISLHYILDHIPRPRIARGPLQLFLSIERFTREMLLLDNVSVVRLGKKRNQG